MTPPLEHECIQITLRSQWYRPTVESELILEKIRHKSDLTLEEQKTECCWETYVKVSGETAVKILNVRKRSCDPSGIGSYWTLEKRKGYFVIVPLSNVSDTACEITDIKSIL